MSSAEVPEVRLAELIAALSLGTDLGLGQPMGHVLRQGRIALGLVERLGLEESERVVTYYVALLAWVGCHSDAYEQAKWFGDDIALKAEMYAVDMRGTAQISFLLRRLGAGAGAGGAGPHRDALPRRSRLEADGDDPLQRRRSARRAPRPRGGSRGLPSAGVWALVRQGPVGRTQCWRPRATACVAAASSPPGSPRVR